MRLTPSKSGMITPENAFAYFSLLSTPTIAIITSSSATSTPNCLVGVRNWPKVAAHVHVMRVCFGLPPQPVKSERQLSP